MIKKVWQYAYILILLLFICLTFVLLCLNTKFSTVKISSLQADHSSDVLRDGKINVNTADEKTLALLNGIGIETANEITKYRKEHGPFRRIDDLGNVKGIGNATLRKIRDYITVGG